MVTHRRIVRRDMVVDARRRDTPMVVVVTAKDLRIFGFVFGHLAVPPVVIGHLKQLDNIVRHHLQREASNTETEMPRPKDTVRRRDGETERPRDRDIKCERPQTCSMVSSQSQSGSSELKLSVTRYSRSERAWWHWAGKLQTG